MNVRYLTLIGIVLGACGCRTNPQVAMLELENRLLEDRIYQLQDQLAKQERQLAACTQTQPTGLSPGRAENAARGAEGSSSAPSATTPPRPTPGPYVPPEGRENGFPSRPPAPKVQMPEQALPPGQLPEIFHPQPTPPPTHPQTPVQPELNSPGPSDSPGHPERGSGETPRTLPTSSGASRPIRPPQENLPAPGSGWLSGSASNQVQAIRVSPELTQGYDADGQPGHEGILVGFAPLDAAGRLVPAAAPISIVVLDPAISGESARVARWDFTAEEITALTQTLQQGESLRLALIWPNELPQHNRLHLFVRYTTADGRKLQADMPLEVDVQGRQILRQSVQAVPGDSRISSPMSNPLGYPSGTSLVSSATPSVPHTSAEDSQRQAVPSGSIPPASQGAFSRPANTPTDSPVQSRIPWKPYR